MPRKNNSLTLPNLEQAIDPFILVKPEEPLAELIGLMSGVDNNSESSNSSNFVLEEENLECCEESTHSFERPIGSNCALVIESHQIIGVVTEWDVVRVVATGRVWDDQLSVAEVMSQPAMTLTFSKAYDIFTPLLFFHQHQIRHLPILSNTGTPLGIVTPASMLQALPPLSFLKLGRVEEVMNTRLLCAAADDSILSVAQRMVKHGSTYALVYQLASRSDLPSSTHNPDGTPVPTELSPSTPSRQPLPVGIVSESKILQAVAAGLDLAETPASAIMGRLGDELHPQDSLLQAYEQMRSQDMQVLIVSEQIENLPRIALGFISPLELLQALQPAQIYQKLKSSQQSVHQLMLANAALLHTRNAELEKQVQQRTAQLQTALAKVERQAKQAALLNEIVQAMRGTLRLEEILQTTANQLHEALQVSRCLIFRPDAEHQLTTLHPSEASNEHQTSINTSSYFYHYYHSQLVAGQVLALSQADLTTTPKLQDATAICHLRSLLIAPLIYKNTYMGCISLHQCDQDRQWTPEDIEFVKIIADHCAVAIYQSELYQQIQTEVRERRRVATALQFSEELFYQLVENIQQIFYVRDPIRNKMLYISPAYETIWGYKIQTLYQQPTAFLDAVHPDDRNSATASFEGKELSSSSKQEYRMIRPNGELRWVWCRAFPLYNEQGEIYRIAGIIEDITERKQAEITLKTSETLFRSLTESSPIGIFMGDARGRCIYTNPRYQEICHCTFEEALGEGWVQLIHPEYQQKLWELWLSTSQSYGIFSAEYPVQADQGIRWVQGQATPLFSEEHQLIGYVGTLQDITDSKLAQEHLLASLQEKEVLLKEVHHRVKNNLQIITSLLDLQSQRIKDKQTWEIFHASQNRIKSMALIHERLYQSDNMARINFQDYTRHLIHYLLHAYAIDPTRINLRLNCEPLNLNIDTAIPCGLITNELTVNALKHAFPNNAQGEILIDFKLIEDDFFQLIIQDNGRNAINLNNFDTQKSLGLKLIKSLVRQLESQMIIEQNQGTKFQITFKELS